MGKTNEVVLFETKDKEITLPVSIENEMVWLSANQMSVLFGRDEKTVRKHINNVFADGELDKDNNTQKMRVEGVKQKVPFYTLEAPAMLCLMTLRSFDYSCSTLALLYPYIGLVLVVFAALRLAKFNTDERQTTSFLGLAVPANALFWCGLFQMDLTNLPFAPWIIGLLVLLFAGLMVSEIPMFSLKFKSLRWSDNKIRFIFLIVSVVILILLHEKGLAAVIGWYIILSILTKG